MRISNINTNSNHFRFTYKRHTAGTDWLGVASKLGFDIDDTKFGFVEFNPENLFAGMSIGTNNIPRLQISHQGVVGIGTTPAAILNGHYKLYVETGIRTRKVKVDLTTWADYVFEKDFEFMPLSELEQYVQLHKHLPDVPSAKEVQAEGLDLGANQAVLLKKIEALTLYVIELGKQLQEMKVEMDSVQIKLKSINRKKCDVELVNVD